MRVSINALMKTIEDMKVQEIGLKSQAAQLEEICADAEKKELFETVHLKRILQDILEERKKIYELVISLTHIKEKYLQSEEKMCDRVDEVYIGKVRMAVVQTISFSEEDMEVIRKIVL